MAHAMMTLRQLDDQPPTLPTRTTWYLTDLAEARGKHELFTRQSPQRLKVLLKKLGQMPKPLKTSLHPTRRRHPGERASHRGSNGGYPKAFDQGRIGPI